MNPLRLLRATVVYGFLSVMAFLSVFPFLWMAVGATNATADIIKGKVTEPTHIDVPFTLVERDSVAVHRQE